MINFDQGFSFGLASGIVMAYFLYTMIIGHIKKKPLSTNTSFPKTTMTLKIEAKIHMEAKVRVSMEAKVSIIEAKVHMYPENA